MPKNFNYPLASFQKSYALAAAVDELGGSCSVEECAKKLKRKISGGFMVIVSSARKFNLIQFEKGIITISNYYKLIKLAYTKSEKTTFLRKCFLSPQVFAALYERFKGKELSSEILEKMLVREFDVSETNVHRIAGYFMEGLNDHGLLKGNIVLESAVNEQVKEKIIDNIDNIPVQENSVETVKVNEQAVRHTSFTGKKPEGFLVQISGEGINLNVSIVDEEDLSIIEASMKKIRKTFK